MPTDFQSMCKRSKSKPVAQLQTFSRFVYLLNSDNILQNRHAADLQSGHLWALHETPK